jgi:RNA polymerase sigma-70 factor (ECF subfamily)
VLSQAEVSDGVCVVDPSVGGIAVPEALLSVDGHAADAEPRAWIGALSSVGAPREDAVAPLHGLLVRASRFEVARRRRALGGGSAGHLDDLAMQAADDALVAILRKLDTFRGDSRFTTRAYKSRCSRRA